MKRRLFKKAPLLTLGIYCLIMTSCKKSPELPENVAANKTVVNDVIGIPSYPLDWENITFMPRPAGYTPVPMPWQSSLGGRKIDDDIVYDYKKADGWELVYNTFNTQEVFNPSYFTLYNKYRGVLRTYFYFSTPSAYPSSNINYILRLRGARAGSSPMLNFASKDIVDVGVNSSEISQIQPYLVSVTGSWYASEYEIAYDPLISATNFRNLQLDWMINSNSIQQITLNGIETGTISGTLTQNKGGENFFGGLANGLVDAGVKVGNEQAVSNIKFLNAAIKGPIVSALTNGAGGIIKGFFSGILGGTSATTTQKVDLKINSKISITGQGVVESQLFNNIYTLPGTLENIYSSPYYPNYDNPMGVFYISSKPVVKINILNYNLNSPEDFDGLRTRYTFDLDENSFNIQYNPSLLAVANIQNLRKDVLLTKSFSSFIMDRSESIIGEENVAGLDIFGVNRLTLYGFQDATQVNSNLVVRISFDVVPKNGAPKVTIVKTFNARGEQI